MVGIPGKSKGCTTCRRRKIKCDGERPACARCRAGRRECEGYEKFSVFINRSQDGLVKRKHLEETIPQSTSLGRSNQTPPMDMDLVLSFQLDTAPIHFSAMAQSFLDGLAPSVQIAEPLWSPTDCYRHALSYSSPPPMLQRIVEATMATRHGRATHNQDLINAGKRCYGRALSLIQQALNDPMRVHTDELLLTVYLMIEYESFEATTDDSTGWHNHIAGLAMLIKFRGPNNITSLVARAVVERSRETLVIQAMMTRRSSFLAHPEWHGERPATGQPTWTSRIVELGFQVAALLEQADNIARTTISLSGTDVISRYLADTLEIAQQLEQCAADMVRNQGSKLACEMCGTEPHLFQERHSFRTTRSMQSVAACDLFFLVSTVLSIRIVVVTPAAVLCGVTSPPPTSSMPAAPAAPAEALIATRTGVSPELVDAVRSYCEPARVYDIACTILDLAVHCMHDELGLTYNRNVIFPLQVTRWVFKQYPAKAQQNNAVLERLTREKHVLFAKRVNQGQEHVPLLARTAAS